MKLLLGRLAAPVSQTTLALGHPKHRLVRSLTTQTNLAKDGYQIVSYAPGHKPDRRALREEAADLIGRNSRYLTNAGEVGAAAPLIETARMRASIAADGSLKPLRAFGEGELDWGELAKHPALAAAVEKFLPTLLSAARENGQHPTTVTLLLRKYHFRGNKGLSPSLRLHADKPYMMSAMAMLGATGVRSSNNVASKDETILGTATGSEVLLVDHDKVLHDAQFQILEDDAVRFLAHLAVGP